ncbi:conjugal transfer protein TrbJ, partial [Nocardioides sp. Y6]|nr:conjugal transfer protein TrbJ [Nocardioides malaquae]
EQLKGKATTAQGQLEARGYANQFASQQANQLMQIRGLLLAQQNAIATQMQAQQDRQAQQDAAGAKLREGSYRASPSKT